MFGNRRYFRELLAGSEEGIASNILADRLKRLVNAGLLTREDAGPGRNGTGRSERHGTPGRGLRRRALMSYVDRYRPVTQHALGVVFPATDGVRL
jgi:hypothetical protein